MEEKVYSIVSKIMKEPNEKITDNTSPETLENWDSLNHIKLILSIEEEMRVQFNDDEITSITSVGKLLDILKMKE